MEPKDFARIILRRKRTVATAIVVVLLTALLGSMRKSPQYVASCEVLYQAVAYDPTEPNAKPFESIGQLADNARFIKTQLAGAVLRRLKLPADAVVGKLADVTVPPGEQVFQLQVADSPGGSASARAGFDPRRPGARAGAICNAYANEYVAFKRQAARDNYQKLVSSKKSAQLRLFRQVDEIETSLDRASRQETLALTVQRNSILNQLSDLQGRISGLQQILDSGIDGGGLVTPSTGGVRVGADHRRDVILGLLVGLMFGIGIALVREYLDDTVRDKESTQRDLGLPVLANLPATDAADGFGEPGASTVEAARTLRATLASMGFPHEKSMLVITSSLSKTRSTTLVSLAAAVAESGRSVLVIGSDLRSGRTHEGFGIANTVGLANVVRGQVPFEKAIRPAPGLDGVYVLPCGPIIGNPGELLSSEEMAFTLRKARRWADVVLLDAPPVLAAADASILGAYADGVILVLAAGSTNRAQANEAKEQLVAAGGRVLGAVLIGSDEPGARAANSSFHDDLPPMMPFGDWSSFDTGYDDAGYDESGWYGDGVMTATARTAPRPNNGRRAPAKKTAAESVKRAPAARTATGAKRAPARTGTAKSAGTATKRSGSTSSRKTPSPLKKPVPRARASTPRATAPIRARAPKPKPRVTQGPW